MDASVIAKTLIELIAKHGDAKVVFGHEKYNIIAIAPDHVENLVDAGKTDGQLVFKIYPQ